MWRKASTNASWAMSGASSRSPHSPTAEATAMSSNRSMSSGQALASPRWAAPTSATQRSRSSTSVITREEPARPGRLPAVTDRQGVTYGPGGGDGAGAQRGCACRTIVQDDPCFSTGTKPTDS